MKKIVITIPENLTLASIARGLSDAFRKNGFFVFETSSLNDTVNLHKIRPEYIFSFDYEYFHNESLIELIQDENPPKLMFYFTREPDNKRFNSVVKKINSSVFLASEEYKRIFSEGIFLPFGVNPSLYKFLFEKYDHQITYIGNISSDKKAQFISKLIKKYGKISVFCHRDYFEKSLNTVIDRDLLTSGEVELFKASYKGFLKTEQEVAQVYNTSKINLNIFEDDEPSINYRVIEVLASSGFLLTECNETLSRYFEVGKELECFSDDTDLFDKIDFYLRNLNLCQAIALNGRKNVVNNHSFKTRVAKILKSMQ